MIARYASTSSPTRLSDELEQGLILRHFRAEEKFQRFPD